MAFSVLRIRWIKLNRKLKNPLAKQRLTCSKWSPSWSRVLPKTWETCWTPVRLLRTSIWKTRTDRCQVVKTTELKATQTRTWKVPPTTIARCSCQATLTKRGSPQSLYSNWRRKTTSSRVRFRVWKYRWSKQTQQVPSPRHRFLTVSSTKTWSSWLKVLRGRTSSCKSSC